MKTTLLKITGTLFFFIGLITQVNAQDIVGAWEGKIAVQGTEIPLVFNITMKDDVYSSTMDSPSQGATDIPMDVTTFVDNTLTVKFNQAGLKYVGVLAEKTLTGTFTQGGNELPLILNKTIKTLPGNIALPTSDADLEKLAN
ncbi:S9 family peptidase, partial [Oceanihabitans sp.]|nr:S9 family peptidase [Oceanihabitans sp.]